MTNREPSPQELATQKLIGQFENSETFAMLEAQGATTMEVATDLTAIAAATFLGDIAVQHQRFMYLSAWHRSAKNACSDRFQELQKVDYRVSRVTLNQVRDLQLLNGVRRGVHRAMVHRFF